MDLRNLLVLSAFLANSILAGLIYIRTPKTKANIMLIIMVHAVSLWCFTMFFYRAAPIGSSVVWAKFLYFFATFIPNFFTLFGLHYPNKHVRKMLTFAIILVTCVMAGLCLLDGYVIEAVVENTGYEKKIIFGPVYYIFYTTYIIVSFSITYLVFLHKFLHSDTKTKKQIVYFALGLLTASLPAMMSNLILPTYFNYFELNWVGQVCSFLWVGILAYAVMKHQLLDIKFVVIKTVAYGLLVLVMALIYANIFFVIAKYILNVPLSPQQLEISTLIAVLMAFSFQPLQNILERSTDKFFYKNRYDVAKVLAEANRLMTTTILLEKLVDTLLPYIFSKMKVSKGSLLLLNDQTITWAKTFHYDIPPTFNEVEIAKILTASNNKLLAFQQTDDEEIKSLFRKHEIRVFVPLYVKGNTEGVILLGEKSSGELYTPQDFKLLDILAPEFAIAIQNSESYQEIQQFNAVLQKKVDESTAEIKNIAEDVYKKNVELAEVSKNLSEANNKLQQLDKLKDEFVSLASHELRTPMTAIKSYLWLFQQYNVAKLDPKERLYIDRAYEATDRLISLVNDMLNVSRIESGRLNVVLKPVDIVQIAREVKDEVEPFAVKQKVAVAVSPQGDIPLVNADSDKIREVIINLVGNSLKFTDEGGKVNVDIHAEKDEVIIQVIDNGRGIKHEDLQKLFQKFGIVGNNQQKQVIQGTGLGLYISKSIVSLHGGKMWVLSDGEAKGTTFAFSLKKAE